MPRCSLKTPLAQMLRYAVPPGYQRQQPARRPKLDAWIGTIDQILEKELQRYYPTKPMLRPASPTPNHNTSAPIPASLIVTGDRLLSSRRTILRK